MRKLLLFCTFLCAACQSAGTSNTMSKPPATTTPTSPAIAEPKLAVAPDVAARVEQLPRTVIDYDRSLA